VVQKRAHIIHLHSADIWRGAEKQLAYLIEGLSKEVFRQTLFCIEGSPIQQHASERKWIYIPYKRVAGANLGLACKILQFTSKEQVDLIHIHDSHSLNAWWIARTLGVKTPAILHRRAHFPTGQDIFSRLKYKHPGIKKVICVSENVRQMMLPLVKDESKLEVIFDAVDYTYFHDTTDCYPLEKHFPQSKGKFKVASIAALVDHKDIPTFINMAEEMIKNLGRKDIHFFIIGEGILSNELKSLVDRKGLQKHITFTGFMKDMPAVMKSLDIYVFTSKSEAFGSTILESLSAGLPVVVTATGAGKEILRHGKDAWIADIGDFKSLAHYVNNLLTHHDMRNHMIFNGYQTAQSFSVNGYVQQMEAVYLSCINNATS
jgi:glycosyltransferase involved in cell wall biosynthesis